MRVKQMPMLYKGAVSVVLISLGQTDTDPFGAPIYTETQTTIDHVLIGEPSTDDVTNDLQMYGKRCAYTLAIPKGDTNIWEDQYVEFYGRRWHVYGNVTQGIDELVPGPWNKKVHVEAYANE